VKSPILPRCSKKKKKKSHNTKKMKTLVLNPKGMCGGRGGGQKEGKKGTKRGMKHHGAYALTGEGRAFTENSPQEKGGGGGSKSEQRGVEKTVGVLMAIQSCVQYR